MCDNFYVERSEKVSFSKKPKVDNSWVARWPDGPDPDKAMKEALKSVAPKKPPVPPAVAAPLVAPIAAPIVADPATVDPNQAQLQGQTEPTGDEEQPASDDQTEDPNAGYAPENGPMKKPVFEG